MIAIITIFAAFPLGFFMSSKLAAFVAYIAIYAQCFVFQTSYLTRMWVGGDHSAFPKDPDALGLSYLVVSSAIYAIGFGLVWFGHRVGSRRRVTATASKG